MLILHYLLNTPFDNLVWDVGHQAYPHKILTGRKNQIHTIRKKAGLAPFPSISESKYDSFGVGHSSTSISALLGMAVASQGESEKKNVAVIGAGVLGVNTAYFLAKKNHFIVLWREIYFLIQLIITI